MLPEPVRKFSAAVEAGLQVAEGVDGLELPLHRIEAWAQLRARGIVVEADDDVTAVCGREIGEDWAECAVRRHFVGDSRGRHRRLLDLKAGESTGHKVTAKVLGFHTAVNVQPSIGRRMGTAPPDGANGKTCVSQFRLA